MDKHNILFIVIDSLRADHTPICGYERDTTPSISAIENDGFEFSNVFSAAPWTPPSHASMFSGLYPSHHGYFEGGMSVDSPHPLLAETLSRRGYETFGAVRNWHVDGQKDVTRGIRNFLNTYRLPKVPKNFHDLNKYYLSLLKGYFNLARDSVSTKRLPSDHISTEYISTNIHNSNTPFFSFINIAAPHSPYAPPKRFAEHFESFDRSEVDMNFLRSLSMIDGNGLREFLTGQLDVPDTAWKAIQDWYDGEILFADSLVSRLISKLKREGLYDETIVIITSDHGEHFGENGRASHGYSLYDELLHVPLVIKPAANSHSRPFNTDKMISLVDLYPTILSELNIDVPQTIDGTDIFSEYERDNIFAEYSPPETTGASPEEWVDSPVNQDIKDDLSQPLQCVRTDEYKYILKHRKGGELYKMERESPKDRLLTGIDREDLRDLITEQLGTDFGGSHQYSLDAKSKKNLENLGYL